MLNTLVDKTINQYYRNKLTADMSLSNDNLETHWIPDFFNKYSKYREYTNINYPKKNKVKSKTQRQNQSESACRGIKVT